MKVLNSVSAHILKALGMMLLQSLLTIPPSITDEEVLKIAVDEQRVLITNDKDFGELVFRSGYSHMGVILLRLKRVPLQLKQERLAVAVTSYTHSLRHFIIVTLSTIRVRKKALQHAA